VSGRLRARFELVRLPNTFTAAADVVAGFLYAGGGIGAWASAAVLAVASACLYGGGAALNDVCDATRDAVDRPARPIPSGRIARSTALRLSIALLGLGIAFPAAVSVRAGAIALALVVSIVLYNVVFKTLPVAPAFMGACRALNLLLGMSPAPRLDAGWTLLPVVLMWLYVTSLTFFARREAAGGRRRDLAVGTLGVCGAVSGLTTLAAIGATSDNTYLAPVVALVVLLGIHGFKAAGDPQPTHVQRAVKLFVLCLVAFDASLVWAVRGPVVAAIVASFLLPAIVLARRFRVT